MASAFGFHLVTQPGALPGLRNPCVCPPCQLPGTTLAFFHWDCQVVSRAVVAASLPDVALAGLACLAIPQVQNSHSCLAGLLLPFSCRSTTLALACGFGTAALILGRARILGAGIIVLGFAKCSFLGCAAADASDSTLAVAKRKARSFKFVSFLSPRYFFAFSNSIKYLAWLGEDFISRCSNAKIGGYQLKTRHSLPEWIDQNESKLIACQNQVQPCCLPLKLVQAQKAQLPFAEAPW